MIWVVLLAPLLGSILCGFVASRASKVVSQAIAVAMMATAFVAAVLAFWGLMSTGGQPQSYPSSPWTWIQAGAFSAPFGLMWDRLSGLMTLIITGVGLLIHIYAGGYLHEEKSTARFFAYLNLFVFMMLLLVLGDNMLLMFVGWEGVGLCSYLLIGYWYQTDENVAAGTKAFIVNRIGDIGFLVGIFLTFTVFGTIVFSEIADFTVGSRLLADETLTMVTLITLALFIGACGKSAQIPLYVWLPDAMAGPTPVSALIHAATMVTAGVYMMARLNFLFFLSPITMQIVASIGAATALFAATIALVQTDIKKVLAYSTVSQLGYMVMACGVGAFGAGVFHLLTHACFKALLFLGAGSVIVAMHHQQDMQKMGGLRKFMPITTLTFFIGVLAIIGVPGLSGFFSKDEILWSAFVGGGPILWGIGVVTAGLTAFYMVRLFCLTFLGETRCDAQTKSHLQETSSIMWVPLCILAVLSAVIGYLGFPEILGGSNFLGSYLEPVFQRPPQAEAFWSYIDTPHDHAIEYAAMASSIAVAMGAAFLAYVWYRNGPTETLTKMRDRFSGVHQTLTHRYWIDEFYESAFVQPSRELAGFLYRIFDQRLIDGVVNGVGQCFMFFGGVTSFRMSGSLHRHGMILVIGFLCLLTVMLA